MENPFHKLFQDFEIWLRSELEQNSKILEFSIKDNFKNTVSGGLKYFNFFKTNYLKWIDRDVSTFLEFFPPVFLQNQVLVKLTKFYNSFQFLTALHSLIANSSLKYFPTSSTGHP